MKGHRVKHIAFVVLMLIILLPMVQHLTQFSNGKELQGAVINAKQPTWNWDNWLDESYQDSMENYLNDSFGFRPDFVRLHNQIKYSLYAKANARGVILGKDWYMYEWNYIRAHYGLDFIGDSIIDSKVEKMKFIQDTLAKLDKTFLLVLAPGKGSYLPEYFPDTSVRKRGVTNYDTYVKKLGQKQVNTIDFNKWFRNMKDTTSYPLYGKGGIHWSKFGEMLAADSLIASLEQLGSVELPELILDGLEVSSRNKDGDYDIGEGMNLIFQTPTIPMAYPQRHFEFPERNIHKGLVVADSYYWGMFNFGFSQQVLGDGQFWFYNESVYPNSFETPITGAEIDLTQVVTENKFVIMVSTDANLYKFGFGFVDRLYDHFTKEQ